MIEPDIRRREAMAEPRRRLLFGLFLAAPFAAPVRAEYPERPVRLIVPQAAGSATDTLARLLGPELADGLGQPRGVRNRLNRAIDAAVHSPRFMERFAAFGDEPGGGTAEAFSELIVKDSAKWGEVVRRSGARLD